MLPSPRSECAHQLDVIRRHISITEGVTNSLSDTLPFGVRSTPVMRIGTRAKPDDLGVDSCAAGAGVLQLLQDQQASAFGRDQARPDRRRKAGTPALVTNRSRQLTARATAAGPSP